jgi:glycerol-3-phosphate dehydrogenase subunit B
MIYDCAIVGAGLAGLSAAVRVTESGLRPLVVAKGVGSLHLGGATIDVLGYSDGGPVDSPAAALPAFCAARPAHPYNHLSTGQIEAGIEWLKQRCGGFAGDLSTNMLIPTAVGVPKPSAVAPESIAAGDLRTGGDVLLVGFNSMKDFYPRLAADNLEHLRPDVTARGVEIQASPVREPDVNTIRYARAFDDAEFLKEVIREVEGRLDGAARVGFPAVLGIRDPGTVWRGMQDALGVEVFEVPTLPPSIPGIRLFEQLKSRLRAGGGRLIVNNTVVGARSSGPTVTELVVDNGTRHVSVPARAVILATGGVAAGGIAMNSMWEVFEPAVGLPVAGVPAPSERRFDPDLLAEHPLNAAGIATDEHFRPVDATGAVVYENLFVAGATLAGARPWREGSGNGISLATGLAAAERVVERLMAWN